jgi:peptidyl-prolyl cis-trans isomerase A (cyclophilin A)
MTFLIDQLIKKIKKLCNAFFLAIPILVSLGLNTAIFANDILRLTIKGNSTGVIDIRLNEEIAPQHVKRIKLLANEKLYDGVVFHRVISNFMAQTGDVKYGHITSLNSNLVGMGGSEYPMLTEEFSNLPFVQGTVGMARSQDPNSANSQFFIMFEPAPHLNGKYTVVGEVVEGMNVVQMIKKGKKSSNGSVEAPDYIVKAEIIKVESD